MIAERRSPAAPLLIALVAGAALWSGVSMLTGKREAWDASAYWAGAYPAAILISALLGYRYPDRPWRWVLVLFGSQFLAMSLRNGELGGLWPLGILMFGLIALPGVLAAKVASGFSRESGQESS